MKIGLPSIRSRAIDSGVSYFAQLRFIFRGVCFFRSGLRLPAQTRFARSLSLVIAYRKPLHVGNGVQATALARVYVINLAAFTDSATFAGFWTRILALKFTFCFCVPRSVAIQGEQGKQQ